CEPKDFVTPSVLTSTPTATSTFLSEQPHRPTARSVIAVCWSKWVRSLYLECETGHTLPDRRVTETDSQYPRKRAGGGPGKTKAGGSPEGTARSMPSAGIT